MFGVQAMINNAALPCGCWPAKGMDIAVLSAMAGPVICVGYRLGMLWHLHGRGRRGRCSDLLGRGRRPMRPAAGDRGGRHGRALCSPRSAAKSLLPAAGG